MAARLILCGDVNLMHVADPGVPFARVREVLRAADGVFANLECCLHLPPQGHRVEHEGFFADPEIAGAALGDAGIRAVGIANNVNYGEAAILSSIAALDRRGIAHTGAGAGSAAARAPALIDCGGLQLGLVQRSSVFWPTNHEAGENSAGIAVLPGHTAYQVPMHKKGPPMNRPGIPPLIVTWADPGYLAEFCDDIRALRERADIVVASCHWGLSTEVLGYMTEIAHAAIEAGADIVIGHGPHYSLPVEIWRGRPVFYGLGSFSFDTGHGGRQHGDWLGMMASIEIERRGVGEVAFRFVRHDEDNHTYFRAPAAEGAALDRLAAESAARGARLEPHGEEVRVAPAQA
jgi:poly-gamma-glutamate capsule biosynthesis protein CapA/YwtB (metallophosphatase superfamily)